MIVIVIFIIFVIITMIVIGIGIVIIIIVIVSTKIIVNTNDQRVGTFQLRDTIYQAAAAYSLTGRPLLVKSLGGRLFGG